MFAVFVARTAPAAFAWYLHTPFQWQYSHAADGQPGMESSFDERSARSSISAISFSAASISGIPSLMRSCASSSRRGAMMQHSNISCAGARRCTSHAYALSCSEKSLFTRFDL